MSVVVPQVGLAMVRRVPVAIGEMAIAGRLAAWAAALAPRLRRRSCCRASLAARASTASAALASLAARASATSAALAAPATSPPSPLPLLAATPLPL